MSEEKVTYMEVKFSNPGEQKDRRPPLHGTREFSWHNIAASLGILCFILLLTTAGLGYIFFQNSCKCEKVNDPEGHVTSSPVYDHSTLPTSTRRNEIHRKYRSLNGLGVGGHGGFCFQEKGCDIHYGNWSCCEHSCYYFSTEEKTWNESKNSCQQLGFNLIKIDDKEEQSFIQSNMNYSYWVGLHKQGANYPWLWQDGTNPSWTLNLSATTSPDATCARLKKTNIINDFCTKQLYFICEKTLFCTYI